MLVQHSHALYQSELRFVLSKNNLRRRFAAFSQRLGRLARRLDLDFNRSESRVRCERRKYGEAVIVRKASLSSYLMEKQSGSRSIRVKRAN